MMHSVFTKTLYEKRWFIVGWTFGFTALAALMASFYPAMHQDGAIDALVQNMPKAFEGLIGDLANLRDFPAYMASQLFDIRLPLIAGIMAIILGQGLSTAEEESGELRTITSLPISRTRVLIEKWLAMCTITLITTIGLVVGTYAVLPFLDDANLQIGSFMRLVAFTWLLMVTYGTITFAAGMVLGKKSVATFVGTFVIIGSFILTTFGQVVDWLADWEKLSLLYYFPAVDVMKNGVDWTNVLVLGIISIVCLSAAIIVFRRRDIS